MTPEQIVAEFFSIEAGVLVATRIKEGLTNASYRVTGASLPVVVRISNADEKALLIDRHSEAVVLKLVEQAGIGARVQYNEPEAHVLITEEIIGRHPTKEEVGSEAGIKRIATLLSILHSLDTPAGVQSMQLVELLSHYWRLLGPWHDRDKALAIAQESDAVPVRCLCHRDVHHLNLIDDGKRLWLLDWEYAVIGDAYFDLASVCCYHEFNEWQRMQLLDEYEVASSPIKGEEKMGMDIDRLNRMCWLFDYIQELWFAVRHKGIEGERSL